MTGSQEDEDNSRKVLPDVRAVGPWYLAAQGKAVCASLGVGAGGLVRRTPGGQRATVRGCGG